MLLYVLINVCVFNVSNEIESLNYQYMKSISIKITVISLKSEVSSIDFVFQLIMRFFCYSQSMSNIMLYMFISIILYL